MAFGMSATHGPRKYQVESWPWSVFGGCNCGSVTTTDEFGNSSDVDMTSICSRSVFMPSSSADDELVESSGLGFSPQPFTTFDSFDTDCGSFPSPRNWEAGCERNPEFVKEMFRNVMRDDVEAVSNLLSRGIDVKLIRNRAGQSLLQVATQRGKANVREYLVRSAKPRQLTTDGKKYIKSVDPYGSSEEVSF
eukprot:TRINITY_DN25625_c0_g1_i1.p1 TRINITY_DN25625_c0_g1~~TRINITY_DN25625_c0_g1_i1.p1  ORF type:complete len:192 (+),score=26.55 TRINITY_DN25625_c0_g1_i1:114-689(+)